MSERNTLTITEVNKRMMEDNKELLRIIASALYPADIQRYFLRKASSRRGNRMGRKKYNHKKLLIVSTTQKLGLLFCLKFLLQYNYLAII